MDFPRMILCEGPEDHHFLEKLIETLGLPRFHVVHANGNRNFVGAISNFRLNKPRAFEQIKKFLFVGDNDQTPKENLEAIQIQIERIFGAGSSPLCARNSVRIKGGIYVDVLMLPWDEEEGHLEALCLEAAKHADARSSDAVDHFLAIAGADNWANRSRYCKAWLDQIWLFVVSMIHL